MSPAYVYDLTEEVDAWATVTHTAAHLVGLEAGCVVLDLARARHGPFGEHLVLHEITERAQTERRTREQRKLRRRYTRRRQTPP